MSPDPESPAEFHSSPQALRARPGHYLEPGCQTALGHTGRVAFLCQASDFSSSQPSFPGCQEVTPPPPSKPVSPPTLSKRAVGVPQQPSVCRTLPPSSEQDHVCAATSCSTIPPPPAPTVHLLCEALRQRLASARGFLKSLARVHPADPCIEARAILLPRTPGSHTTGRTAPVTCKRARAVSTDLLVGASFTRGFFTPRGPSSARSAPKPQPPLLPSLAGAAPGGAGPGTHPPGSHPPRARGQAGRQAGKQAGRRPVPSRPPRPTPQQPTEAAASAAGHRRQAGGRGRPAALCDAGLTPPLASGPFRGRRSGGRGGGRPPSPLPSPPLT